MTLILYYFLSALIWHDTSAFIQLQHLGFVLRPPNCETFLKLTVKSRNSEPSIPLDIENLMVKHDPILLFASRLLPSQTASDASALYAWCRRLDEITDDSQTELAAKQQKLKEWEDRFLKLYNGSPLDEMDEALYQCIQRNSDSLTKEPFLDMIAGMKSDAVPNRKIANMEELEVYAYQVAGTVGVMLLSLLHANVEGSRALAIALGKAIQLINILRDASPDAAMGRVYLPQDLLLAEGVSIEAVLSLTSSEGYCSVVRKVAARAKELLLEAELGKSLPGIGPLFVQIIVELYRGYLTRLERIGYDNLNVTGERVNISLAQKLIATFRALSIVYR